MPRLKVLIADDHAVVRSGLVAIINAQPDMVVAAEAENGRAAVDAYFESRPDVALIDLRMPLLEGVEVTEEIRRRDSRARIVILTTYETDDDIDRVLRAGAKAYQLKDVRTADLVACIRDVYNGKICVSPAVAARLAERVSRAQLTSRELEVLRLLVDGKSNKEIGSLLFISESTVKLHINNLYEKLGVSNRTEAMKVSLQRGLVRLR